MSDNGINTVSDNPKNDSVVINKPYTVESGFLTVATTPDYSPFEFYIKNSDGSYSLAGLDISLAQYIADYLDLKLKFVLLDFDSVLSELSAKRVDCIIAALYAEPERENDMDFSDPYLLGEYSIGVSKGNKELLADINTAIKSAIDDGSIDSFYEKAQELASGDIYEGLLQ